MFTTVFIVVPALSPQPPRILVNGERVTIKSKHFTVGDAVDASDVKMEPGAVLSVVTHKLLGNDGALPQVLLNGQFTELSAVVYSGDQITVVPVPETIERLITRQKSDGIAGLPDIEKTLFHPGRSVTLEQKVGERSGEVVSEVPIPGPEVPAQPVTEKLVALTFDDGPDPAWTPQVLEILESEGIHATFCMIGYLVTRSPDLAREVASKGHTICNHTANHALLDKAAKDKVTAEVMGGADIIKEVIGFEAPMYRPPGGRLSPTVIDVAHERGQRVLHWSLDTSDYLGPPGSVLVDRVKTQAAPGSVILMHDGGGDRTHTVVALRPMIQALKEMGYGFTTPTEVPPVT